ncbi:AAA family ATPase [Loktanella sp. R86503]|uniref:AAA family ATPase n=1 Tax=Loktanella sp. R86503 TaxID=3093847 RepID=UPI0036DA6C32
MTFQHGGSLPRRDPSTFDYPPHNMDSFDHLADMDRAHMATFPRMADPDKTLLPTTYVWRDPAQIPPRPWVYGRHLLRGQASVTVAPGGLGKSSLSIVEGLAMVTGRDLLGDHVHGGPKSVWLFNLEDPRDELERRIAAAMQLHGIGGNNLGDRLHIDSGRDRPLCTAIQTRDGAHIIEPVFDDLARQIRGRKIDVLVVDPFVSSHQVGENDNGAIDLVAKKWAKLADECNCAIELVHHTRKTNGDEATTEAARGASALLSAARSGRVLNRMTKDERESAGIPADDLSTYFAVTRDKANLAPAGARQWRHMASVQLANGDDVGVAEPWTWPDTFDGMTVKDLLAVQNAIEGKYPRYSDQAGDDWAGVIVADVLGMDTTTDRKRIKKIIETWIKAGALVKVMHEDKKRMKRPCLEVGEWATE